MSCTHLEAFVGFEKHPLLLQKRAIYFLIFGAFILLCVFFFRRRSPESILTVKVVPVSSVVVGVAIPSIDFDSASYYRPILAYNLFRPLGWAPARPVEPYRLIGTRIVREGATPPQAILETTAGHQTYIVGAGDTLDAGTKVVDISDRSVVLSTGGIERTLSLGTGIWLNPSGRSSVVIPRRSVRPSSLRNRRPVSPARSSSSPRRVEPSRSRPLSKWETVDGEVIRIGDARLKNPAKWGLRRRLPSGKFD